MSFGFFLVGAIIFSLYIYFTIWNIFYSSKKQREENYPSLKNLNDKIDADGMGNYEKSPDKDS